MRLKVFAAFCLTLLLAAVCLVPGDSARAQRARRRGQQAAPAQSAQAPGPQQDRPKQVIIGRGSDTDRGSRMTITSDNPLNDYSAYRSGDRFYVELPNANADTAARAAGKGFTDLQVQRRGKNVVLSYRVRPGAKPRVEQRFNRLEVVFEVPEGEAARAAQSPQQQSQANAGGEQPGRAAQNQTPTQPAPQPAEQNPSADRRPQPAPTAAGQSAAAQQQPAPGAPAGLAGQPATFGQAGQLAPAEQAPTPIEQSSPIAAQPPAGEVAQAQVPAPAAPATATTGTAGAAGSGVSIGAYLQRNWMMVLVAALLVLGVGLLIAARRSSGSPRTPAEARDREGAAELKEPAAAQLKEPSAPAAGAGAVATAAASLAAAKVAAQESKKAAKKSKKARAAEAAREEKRAAREAKQPAVAADKKAAEETAAVVAPVSPAAEVAAAPEPAAPEVAAAEPTVLESPVAESPAAEAVAEAPAVAEASVVGEASAVEAAEVVPVVAGVVAAEEARPGAPAEELKAEPVEEVKGVEAFVPAEPEALTKEVAPLDVPDPDRAREETKRLLEGETYDRAAISTRDAMARQMIAAELLSALSGRSPERRERARAAFIEHGYFEEKAEDLRKAEAAAERASAARALGLAGDRAATPHLVGALEDDAVEVRRAAVESLAGLRDPAAVAPLEALLRREKKSKTKVNRKLVEHAVQTCRAGAAEEPLPAVAAALTAATVAEPAVSELAVAEPEEAEAVAEPEEAAAVEEVTTETAIEPSVGAAEESAAAEAVEEPSLFVEEPAAEIASGAEAAHAAETTVGLGEEEADEETLIAEAPADETPTLVAEAETIEVAPPEAFEEVSPSAGPSVSEEEPEAAVSEETVEVEAAEAASPAGLAVAEPTAEEAAEVGVEAYEEVAETGVEAYAGPAVEELPQVEEVPAEEAGAEPTLFEEEVAESPSADETSGEEPAPWFVEPSAEAEEGGTARRGGRAEEWVELDMGELNPVTPTASPEFFAETYETPAAEPAESPAREPEPVEPLTFEHSAIEPAGREYPAAEVARVDELELFDAPSAAPTRDAEEKGVALFDEYSSVPAGIQQRLASHEPEERAVAVAELARVDAGDAFQQLCAAFDDESKEVRSAAARALYDMQGDRADTFTRALREAGPERRRNIGAAIATSGLAADAISQLTGESREKTYEAFSLLFLMAKAGEVAPLVRAIEGHPNSEVRLAVVKLLALSGQKEILPAFRRLAVRGSLPTEVRSAVMEAIYQISSQSEPTPAA